MSDIDITNQCEFGFNDKEILQLEKCACGKVFDPWMLISIYRDIPTQCPRCGRLLYFRVSIKIMQIGDKKDG